MGNLPAREAVVHMTTYRRQPLTLVRGQGTRVFDDEGRSYLDFIAGIAVDALGHAHPGLTEVIAKQAGTLIQVSNLFYTEPQIELAELLVGNSALDRVFFCNSGAEANEAAIKMARKWGILNRNGAYEIIATHNGFHGRTLGSVAASKSNDALKRELCGRLPALTSPVSCHGFSPIAVSSRERISS